MDQRTRDELKAGFELQLKHQFYLKPEFPFLHSMGCNHVFFPVKNDEMDFGFLILEWTPEQNHTWIGTWVDNEEELNNYKYKREGIESIVNLPALIKIFAERMAQVHHKNMMRKKEEEEWNQFLESTPNPYLN